MIEINLALGKNKKVELCFIDSLDGQEGMTRREPKWLYLTLTSQHFPVVFSNTSLPGPLLLGRFPLPHQELEILEQGFWVCMADGLSQVASSS